MKRILLFALLFQILIASCSSAPKAETPEPSASAVFAADKFYTIINNAQDQTRLDPAWDLLSSVAQCATKSQYQCNLDRFRSKWWASKVIYKIYDCGSNGALVEEKLYPRDADPSLASPDVRYVRFYMAEDSDGVVRISKMEPTNTFDSECVLAIDSSARP